jgi:hypothetical protein
VTAPKAQLIIATSIRLAKQIKSSDYKIGKGYRLPPPSRRGRKERSSPFPSPDYSFPSRLASSPPPPPRNQGQAMEASGPEAANPGIDGSADPCSSAGRLSVHQIVGGGKGTATTLRLLVPVLSSAWISHTRIRCRQVATGPRCLSLT